MPSPTRTHTARHYSTLPTSGLEYAKRAAAEAAVKGSLKPTHKVIGVGSGSTIVSVVEALKRDKEANQDRT